MQDFKLPIEYLKEKYILSENIKTDLELVETYEKENKSIYQQYLQPKTLLGKKIMEKQSNIYTTNKQYIEETQKTIDTIDTLEFDPALITNTYNSWREIKDDIDFTEKYQYIGWEKLKWLNYSKLFLHILSVYNLFSPIVNLLSPLLMFIIPYFILKFMRLKITWPHYKNLLMMQIRNHAIGRLFTSFADVKPSQKLYILFCAGMYVYNFYQNILSCKRFYKNSYFIAKNISLIRKYIMYTKEKMKLFKKITEKFETYKDFNNKLSFQIENLEAFYKKIQSIPEKCISFKNFFSMGKTMECFFSIHDSTNIEEYMEFSFKFNGYIDCLFGIKDNCMNKKINKVTIKEKEKEKEKEKKDINNESDGESEKESDGESESKNNNKKDKTKNKKENLYIKKMFHPSIEKPIKNDITLDDSKLITGPNAAGKTTILKSALINIILSQQYGFGYFDTAKIIPYDYIHCYLNIPDTSGRDSLFQAEARRCKNILDVIEKNKDKRHICIFDELYSGTNPYEAISSAYSYLNYINKNKNITFLLTTHFIRLCKLMKSKKNVKNYCMKTKIQDYKPEYFYKIQSGISTIKGGISVLKEIGYPEEVLKTSVKILEDLN